MDKVGVRLRWSCSIKASASMYLSRPGSQSKGKPAWQGDDEESGKQKQRRKGDYFASIRYFAPDLPASEIAELSGAARRLISYS